MAKLFKNLVVLMEPSNEAYRNSVKGGNMYLNRFCIDENAAFELSGVLYLEKSSDEIINGVDFKHERITKGKGLSLIRESRKNPKRGLGLSSSAFRGKTSRAQHSIICIYSCALDSREARSVTVPKSGIYFCSARHAAASFHAYAI